jgi:hypothetical protein
MVYATAHLRDPVGGWRGRSHLWDMLRPLLIAAVLLLAASPALAYCPTPPATEDGAENLANQRELMLCEAAQLHDQTALKSQQLQFQADLQAQQQNFELELKMQQTFAAAATPVVPQQF